VGECIEHLNQTGYSLGEALSTGIDSAFMAGETGDGPISYSCSRNWFAKGVGCFCIIQNVISVPQFSHCFMIQLLSPFRLNLFNILLQLNWIFLPCTCREVASF
jgi:hypothetical protein